MRISDWSSDVCSSDLDILARPGQPKLDVNVNVGVTRPGEDVYEVALKINVTAKVESATSFAVELLYNGLFGLRNVPEEALQPSPLDEAPRLLFPHHRRVISDVTRDGGFAPLMLYPLAFAPLFLASSEEGGVGKGCVSRC